MCEEEIKKVTDSVLKYILPDTCSDAEKEEKSITVEKVVDAIKAGNDVEIINAVITGPFILKSVNVKGEITIKNTKIKGPIDWSYATFKGVLNLKNSIFETDAYFTAVTAEKDIFLDGATFCGKAVFADITVMGTFYSQSTTFKKDAIFTDECKDDLNNGIISDELKDRFKTEGFPISQNSMVTKEKDDRWVMTDGEKIYIVKKEDGKLNIYNPATFVGKTDFENARIGGNAEFTEAVFKQQASFNGAKIKGAAFFNPATFGGDADFGSARIGSTAEFTEAVFKQQASFNSAHIDGVAFFDPATFGGEANFVSVRIGSNADFARAKFKELANFTRTRIEEDAFFDLATFEDKADFRSVRIGSNAVFVRARFKKLANFNRVQIEEDAFFKQVTFEGEAKFDSAQIERESHFEGTVFDKDVCFQNASLRTLIFGEPNVKFIKNIDLRGCTYDRIQPITFWKQLMEHLGPYDQQPFTQLEETFLRAGTVRLANDVYYERKCRESAQKTIRKPVAWLLDRFHWVLAGYGVRLYRILLALFPILLFGTYIFHLEGAVTPEQLPSMMSSQVTLPLSEAFWVSLNTFLPVVEFPSGADWKPSSQIIPYLGIKFTTFATLLVLAGWILIPIGVAGDVISGLLKRPK